jgi:hypothetical protein
VRCFAATTDADCQSRAIQRSKLVLEEYRPWWMAQLADHFDTGLLLHSAVDDYAMETLSLTKDMFYQNSKNMPSTVLICKMKKMMMLIHNGHRPRIFWDLD